MGRPAVDITGERFNRLIAIQPTKERRFGNVVWLCECDCGSSVRVKINDLKIGYNQSCGCLQKELRYKHGHKVKGESPTYQTWKAMKQRCLNLKKDAFQYYGGKGIMICERWMVFENFLADMGVRPDGMTISRADHDKHYEPDNCSWQKRGTH